MKSLKQVDIGNLIFIDIETTSLVKKLEKGTPLYAAWEYRQRFSRDKIDMDDNNIEQILQDTYDKTAALYPEFSKIVCISIGKIKGNTFQVKSYCSDDEKQLLTEFSSVLDRMCSANKNEELCGHYIKNFDCPFIFRRCLVHDITPPNLIDQGTSKPWEISGKDIHELWKNTALTSASLISIATALGIESPKDEIAGYQVRDMYYSDNIDKFNIISKYCEKDILCAARIICKFMQQPIVNFADKSVEEPKEVPLLTKLFNGAKYDVKTAKALHKLYTELLPEEKLAAQTILKSIITKDTGFTQDNLDALVNYIPKKK